MTRPNDEAPAERVERGARDATPVRRSTPSRDAIAALDAFGGLPAERIRLPASAADCDAALATLSRADIVGFDTESKPTFSRGETSDGPHVVQFATDDEAYVFQMHVPEARAATIALLEAERPVKVGFGLASDRKFLRERFDVALAGVVDLNDVFRRAGYRGTVGVRAAVAIVFGRRFSKSKKQTTSDWSARRLTPAQVLYAANDAWAALAVLRKLDPALATLSQPFEDEATDAAMRDDED